MLLLHNSIRSYAWGTIDGMAELVGTPPSGSPEAELWVGTHPGSPSLVADEAGPARRSGSGDLVGRTLAEVIGSDPGRWLGPDLAAKGYTALPFLLKVLAIGAPLSLQAHPSLEQAEAGFAREEDLAIALDASNRTYRDRGAKPEAMVALRDTWALCGFRDPARAAELVAGLEMSVLDPLVHALTSEERPLASAFGWLLRLRDVGRDSVGAGLRAAVAGVDPNDLADPRAWVQLLTDLHPGDPTALAPLLLEVVRLAPGDSVHLTAGNVHAYLRGAGVEIMAASDNVLRGGLTPKHIDIDELLRIVRLEPGTPPPPARRTVAPGVTVFDAGEELFGLVEVDPSQAGVVIHPLGPSLLLATGGAVDLSIGGHQVSIGGGDAAYCAPREGEIGVSGSGRLWWATTGDALPS